MNIFFVDFQSDLFGLLLALPIGIMTVLVQVVFTRTETRELTFKTTTVTKRYGLKWINHITRIQI